MRFYKLNIVFESFLIQVQRRDLKKRGYIASASCRERRSRNALTLGPNHQIEFNDFVPEVNTSRSPQLSLLNVYVYVFAVFANFSWQEALHGSAILLNHDNTCCPYPQLFLLHEMKLWDARIFMEEKYVSNVNARAEFSRPSMREYNEVWYNKTYKG